MAINLTFYIDEPSADVEFRCRYVAPLIEVHFLKVDIVRVRLGNYRYK